MTDITDIEEKRKKEAEKKRKKELKEKEKDYDEKIPRESISRSLADLLNDDPTLLPKFPCDLYATLVGEDDSLKKIILVSKDNICREASKDFVIDKLSIYLRNTVEIADNPNYFFEDHQVQSCVTAWLRGARQIEEPLSVAFNDDPRRTYLRLPWDFDSNGETPIFDELFSRMTNAEAAKMFIGSLFDDASFRQQYLYLFGGGQDGKGALVNFLLKVFQVTGSMLTCPVDKRGSVVDKHWTASLQNLRLGVFDDLDVFTFLSSGFFKSLTGMGLVAVNPKNKKAYQTDLKMKFIITANRLPILTSTVADRRRAIICELDPPSELKAVETYESRMWKEGGFFLSKCIEAYKKAYPTHAPIVCDLSTVEELGRNHDDEFNAMLSEHFILGKDESIPRLTLYNVLSDEDLGRKAWTNNKIGDFKAWLKVKHKVREQRISLEEGGRGKVYTGIGLKTGSRFWLFSKEKND